MSQAPSTAIFLLLVAQAHGASNSHGAQGGATETKGASPSEIPAVRQHGSGLFATLQIAHVNMDGTVPVPNGTDRILMEIGCSNVGTLDDELLNQDAYSFLLSFEPLLDKYAELAAKGNARYNGNVGDTITPLAHHHQRAVVLPLAVGPRAGTATFNVGHVAGCSSLLQLANNKTGGWAKWCRNVVETRTVPAILLTSALALSPATLPIQLLKIDAQGADLSIIRAAQKADLARVRLVTMELQIDTPYCRKDGLIYNREVCPVTVAYMRSIGFRYLGHAPPKTKHALKPPDASNAEGGGCPAAASWLRARRTWFCEMQGYFLNEEGRWPALNQSEILRYVVPL